MKKLLVFIFLVSSITQAQHTVSGTMTNALETDWVILYKIKGARQQFVQNSTIKKDTIIIDGKNQIIGTFQFQIPQTSKAGFYRITYRTNSPNFVDFIYNNEDVSFTFHPDYPEQSVTFSKSNENIIYKNYLNEISKAQQKLDSLQITAIKNPNLDLNANYKAAFNQVNVIQNTYLKNTNGMYVQPFIKATLRANPSEIKTTAKDYMSNITSTFFDHMDFKDKTLINSSFLVDRITDYVFYINYSENKDVQQKLYKESVKTVLSKIENLPFKKDVIEFLVAQFENTKNLELIDFLFENYYEKLPEGLQNKDYLKEKKALFATEVGRIAPDFSWKENGKDLKLSTLNDAEKYVLVFWSTGCSHCLKEIPLLHKFLQDKTGVKVVAFSLEKNDFGWKNMKATLPNWHHILGLNKWENKIARTYNIMATPTYFILDKNKKIIAKPETLEDLKAFFTKE
ncbi:TlpA family protein disulfide reductase [Polaribacter batillariae]|uniref:TlpA family protein disulfide reductase n=1 Tax=Polaribacter batillariae TaxID=2808900 RepID=A0ABX7STI7_9FLAO|nr:TlpA disulfide reductase family protein [Polaribacter batillariae]QTD36179.1 TlpA family protein disulfide reductase [Polaribacter batillariae]